MNIEAGPLRAEQVKAWIEKNKEYLAHALITNKVELTFMMKGSDIRAKLTQFPEEE